MKKEKTEFSRLNHFYVGQIRGKTPNSIYDIKLPKIINRIALEKSMIEITKPLTYKSPNA